MRGQDIPEPDHRAHRISFELPRPNVAEGSRVADYLRSGMKEASIPAVLITHMPGKPCGIAQPDVLSHSPRSQ